DVGLGLPARRQHVAALAQGVGRVVASAARPRRPAQSDVRERRARLRLRPLTDRYLGAKRCPPSSRIVEPFNIGFSMMASAIRAYSIGRPMRFGNAASLVRPAAISSGMPCVSPVSKRLGAIAI